MSVCPTVHTVYGCMHTNIQIRIFDPEGSSAVQWSSFLSFRRELWMLLNFWFVNVSIQFDICIYWHCVAHSRSALYSRSLRLYFVYRNFNSCFTLYFIAAFLVFMIICIYFNMYIFMNSSTNSGTSVDFIQQYMSITSVAHTSIFIAVIIYF